MSVGKDIKTTFPYLAKVGLYKKQKPFATNFIPTISNVSMTNHAFDLVDLVVTDARPTQDSYTLNTEGFCFLTAPTLVTSSVVDDNVWMEENYYSEIESVLHHAFPEYSRLECLDYQIRRRSHLFPEKPGKIVRHAQPAVLPHTDFSYEGGYRQMQQMFPAQEKYYADRDYDLINVWRVLKGPNNDWPLAVCDHKSIDFETDVIANDVLHKDTVGENWLLYGNPNHKWYYLSDQVKEDMIVFRNFDSKGNKGRSFHAAFDSKMGGLQARESIEVRVAAFR